MQLPTPTFTGTGRYRYLRKSRNACALSFFITNNHLALIANSNPRFPGFLKEVFLLNITLIEPKPPGKHVFSTVKMPRLGLPILGTILRQQGHHVNLVYGTYRSVKASDLAGTQLVGISATTSTAPYAYRLADFARSQGIAVVMGGPHVSFMPEEALGHCDYVVRMEGDYTFPALVQCLNQGEIPFEVPGISFVHNGEVIHNPAPDWVDIATLPFPHISVFGANRLSTYPVVTSRGCPYDCTFCSVTPMFGHKMRCRSIESIVEELEQYKGKQVFFVDDNFTASPARAKALMRAMIEKNARPRRWFAQVRTESARDDELLSLMRDSGCGYVYVGMESINPKTLKNYNKRQEVSDIEYCVKRFHDYGIMVHGMFVFGSDEDTAETIEETVSFALKNHIDTVQFMILTPLPGTRTFAELEAAGRIFTREWSLYDAHHVVFTPAGMSAYSLQAETQEAFKRFYSLSNLFSNFQVSGWRSVAFRAVGYWLVRKWVRENKHYAHTLLQPGETESRDAFSLIEQPIFKVIHHQLTKIELFTDGVQALAKMTGKINETAASKAVKSFAAALGKACCSIIIDARELTFASDNSLIRFMKTLNRTAGTARHMVVRLPVSADYLFQLMLRYDVEIPSYVIVPSNP